MKKARIVYAGTARTGGAYAGQYADVVVVVVGEDDDDDDDVCARYEGFYNYYHW